MKKDYKGNSYKKVHYSKVPKIYESNEFFFPDYGYSILVIPSFVKNAIRKEDYAEHQVMLPIDLFLRKLEEGKVVKEGEFLIVDVNYDNEKGVLDDWEEIWEDGEEIPAEEIYEGTEFILDENGVELTVNFEKPTLEEINALKVGYQSVYVFFQNVISFLLWDFRGMSVFETAVIYKADREKYMDLWKDKAIPLKVRLRDISTKKLVLVSYMEIDELDSDFLLENLKRMETADEQTILRTAKTVQEKHSIEEMLELATRQQVIEQFEKFS